MFSIRALMFAGVLLFVALVAGRIRASEAAGAAREAAPGSRATVADGEATASASDLPPAKTEPAAEGTGVALTVRDDQCDAVGRIRYDGESACCGVSRWWLDANYLQLWTNGNAVPALLTTNAIVPPRSQAGVLGIGDTHVLLGNDELDRGGRSGVALTLGYWLDEQQDHGLQVTWMYGGDPSDELHAVCQSPGVPVLARPFFNVATNKEDSQLVAYPNVVEGRATADSSSDLQSVEALARANWRRGMCGRIDLVGGYRYLGFREGLRLEEHLVLRDPGGLAQIGTRIDLFDRFCTRNDFHGGELGVLTSFCRGSFGFDVGGKLGLGNVSREVVIDGSTDVRTPTGGHATSRGGLLTLPSNMGTYRDDAFALLPELDLKVRLQVTERVSMSVGYNLLFLTEVYRTGPQIDRSIDASQLPAALPVNAAVAAGQLRPAPILDSSTLRAQALTMGVTVAY